MSQGFSHVGAGLFWRSARSAALLLAMAANAEAQASSSSCHELVQSPRVEGLLRQDLGAVAVGVPAGWLSRDRDCPGGIYISPEALDLLGTLDQLGEWDTAYEAVVQAVLAGAEPVAHFGAEPWGGSFYSDLQVRLYRSSMPVEKVGERAREEGVKAATEFTEGEVRLAQAQLGRWTRQSISFPLWFWDYGATAVVDFFSAQCSSTTVTLMFMHVDTRMGSEWHHEPLIADIVASTECEPRT